MPQPSQLTSDFTSNKIILDHYLQRISFLGTPETSYRTLRGIHLSHTRAIPFENLNPFLRLPVQLDIDSIQRKIIGEGRGGYCFEHNTLLSHALVKIGFSVRGLAARVLWNVPQGVTPARGHMLLLVHAEGKEYIADTGFGGLTLPEPLEFLPGKEQQTTHEVYRISIDGMEYILEVLIRDQWKGVYRFTLQEQLPPDYEVVNYYLSTNQNSHFLHNIIAARIDEGRRYTLRNNEFTTYDSSGEPSKVVIENESSLKEVLSSVFRINLPLTEDMDSRLGVLFQRA
jgi:N-hydroxyarylamine O-acetyltransferase